MRVAAVRVTAPPPVPAAVRPRKGIAVALMLSLALHAILILGLIDWFQDTPHSPSIVKATLALASGSSPASAPTAPEVASEESAAQGPVAEPAADARAQGARTDSAAGTSERVPSGASEPRPDNGGAAESPRRNLDYAATVRHVAGLDAQSPGVQTRVRRVVEQRTETPEDDWYLQAWRRKVERIGQLNYPDQARARKLYGSLRLLVAIEPDGHLRDVRVLDSSGHRVLDDAAVRIVRLAAPYAPFPPAMRRQTDVLEIVRTWQFKKRGAASAS